MISSSKLLLLVAFATGPYALMTEAPALAEAAAVTHGRAHDAVPRFSVSAFSTTAFQRDRGFSLFSDSPDVRGGGMAFDMRVLQLGRLGVAVRAELSTEESNGEWTYGTTRYESDMYGAGIMVDFAVRRFARPYVQATAGLASTDVRLEGNRSALTADDKVIFTTAAAGLRLITQPKPWWRGGMSLAVSGFLEGGYTAAAKHSFTLNAGGTAAEDAIPTEGVALGQLSRTRPHLRIGVGLHF